MYDFDAGASGAAGPFLNWHARETTDGEISGRTFSLRDADGNREDVTPKFKKGVAFDLSTLKTGWCYSNGAPGVAPEWQWNDSPARFAPQPADVGGEKWKKGFDVRVAIDKETAATWSQAGAGAWTGLVQLMKAVKADDSYDENKAAIVALKGAEELKYKKGSTVVPTLELKKWADKPECLTAPAEDEADDGEAEGDDEF